VGGHHVGSARVVWRCGRSSCMQTQLGVRSLGGGEVQSPLTFDWEQGVEGKVQPQVRCPDDPKRNVSCLSSE